MFRQQLLGWFTAGCAVLATVSATKAEDPYRVGVMQLGTSTDDLSYGVSADGLGNVYISGTKWGPEPYPNGVYDDPFLAKYDSAGTLLWTRQLGTSAHDWSHGVSADGLGNVYISGEDASLHSFVTKYDAAGTFLWTDSTQAPRGQETSVSADALGNVWISGDPYNTSQGSQDVYVAKYDSVGTLLWTQQLGTSAHDWSHGVSADGLGNVYISGQTTGSLGGPNAGDSDAFVAKYDSAGTLLWTQQLGTSRYDVAFAVSADGPDNVYISGMTRGALGGAGTGGSDAFVAKYDSAGTLLWTRQLGTSGSDLARGVSADALGNVYISGVTGGALGGPYAGQGDAFVAKYDSAGTLLWTHQFGTSEHDESEDVSADGLGNVYTSGETYGSLGGPNVGGCDAFVAKLAPATEPCEWVSTGGRAYNEPSNWGWHIVPNGVDTVADFLGKITGDSIITVASPVTVGTINFENANSYTIAQGEPGAGITLATSSGDSQINVHRGAHAISAPISLLSPGLTVDTADGTDLRIEPAEGLSSLKGAVTKSGTGSLILGPRLLLAGPLNVNEGVLEAAKDVLTQATPGGPPRTITLGPLTTLKASGHVNGLVVDAGGLMSPTTLQATGSMMVGQLGSTAGYNYGGILDAGPHAVVLLDDDKADVGIALIAGGSLTGAKGIQLNPATVGFGGFITGSGAIHGVVTAGTPGNPAMGFGGTPPGITVYGDVIGLWNQFDNTTVTGMLQAGFSPAHNPLGPGSNAGTAQFLIGGPLNGEVTFNSEKGEYEKTTGDHTQFLIYGVAQGQPAGAPTVFESLELKLDGDYVDFGWNDLAAGDDIVLIQTAPWQTVQFITVPFPHYETTLVGPGQVEYGSSFEGDLQSALDLIRPKLGTGLDVTYTMNPDGLALHIVPEPGTLALLLSGRLGLLLLVWRRQGRAAR